MKHSSIALAVFLTISCLGCGDSFQAQTQNRDADPAKPDSLSVPNEIPTNVPAVVVDEAASVQPADIVYADKFPEVLAVQVKPIDETNWRFNVTLSSTYDTPQRYADGWRVLDSDGNELGIRVLGHDHASEQPFTRSHTIKIPDGINAVFVEGRDQANGWSGQRFEVTIPASR